MRQNPNCTAKKRTAKKCVFGRPTTAEHQFCKENSECPLQSNTFRKKKS
jgi:hypothetical protein